MNILLLEDNISLNKAISKILTLNSYNVSSFYDGQKALSTIYKQSFDLYIFDINVPNIDGLKLLDIVHCRDNFCKVIIITANEDVQTLKKAYELGCIDFLKKPFHLEELQIKVKKLNIIDNPSMKIELKQNQVLTKMEKSFINLLLKYNNQLVTYNMIESELYYEKSMSIDSLRTLVGRVRKKMIDDTIIVNVTNEGYQILVSL